MDYIICHFGITALSLTVLSGISNAQFNQYNIGSTGSSFETVQFVSNTIGFATGSSGNVYKTVNGGETWNAITSPNGAILFGSEFINENVGYVSGTGGTIYKTIDGGQSWTQAVHSFTDCIYQIAPASSTVIYAGGWGGRVLKSTDGGANFTLSRTDISTQNWIFGMQFTDANTGYAAGENGSIYKTTDGADTWNMLSSTTSNTFRALHFPNASTGYAVGWSGTVVKTSNSGNSWTSLTTGYPNDQYYGVYFTDASNGYIVGQYYVNSGGGIFGGGSWEGLIMKTTDGGTTWTREYAGGKQLNAIITFNGVTTAVGMDQRVISNGTFGTTSVKENESNVSMSLYPNPVRDNLFINLVSDKSQIVSIELFNQTGAHVASVASGNMINGQQQFSVDTRNLSKGFYFVRLSAGNTTQTRKFVLVD